MTNGPLVKASRAGGDAVRLLRQVGHRFVAGIRLVTLVPTVAIAVLVAKDAPSKSMTAVALTIVVGWSLLYSWLLTRRPMVWISFVDAAILAGFALSSQWIVPASWLASGRSWLLPFVSFACVGYQYYAGWLAGGLAACIVIGGMVIGTAVALPAEGIFDSLHTAIWSIVLTVLARVLWTLVHRGAQKADAVMSDAQRARREQILAEEIRADELDHNRRLHDTAATTLLMVGLGQTHRSIELLAAQANRDLTALNKQGEPATTKSDLVAALAETIDLVPLVVDYQGPRELILPSGVTSAIASAAQEALTNIVKHTDVDACLIRVDGTSSEVNVDVVDYGGGFKPEQSSGSGRGLRDSIHGRMCRIGGRAVISSRVDLGTTIHLKWP